MDNDNKDESNRVDKLYKFALKLRQDLKDEFDMNLYEIEEFAQRFLLHTQEDLYSSIGNHVVLN